MRHRWALLVLGLLTGSLVGCVTGEPVRTTSFLDRRPFSGPTGGDIVQLEVRLLQVPVGDPYLNQELWAHTDEQVVALEQKAVLEDNGFRIGQVGGIAPARLQELINSERSCVDGHRIQMHAGRPRTVRLGPDLAQCRFELHQDGRPVPVHLDKAQCTLQVVPTVTREGKVRLHITPQVQHGDRVLLPRPAPDRSGWERQEQRPTEDYPWLSWDVTPAADEFVLVGTGFDRTGTLGHQCFLRADETPPVQRLLVLRASRASAPEVEPPPGEEDDSFNRSPPLALQATWTCARGSSR